MAPSYLTASPNISEIKGACSIKEFKIELDNFLETVPDQPKSDGYIPSACDQSTSRQSNSIISQCLKPKDDI